MNYWITTQWPHSIEYDKEHPHSGIYIKDGHLEVVKDMSPGDLIFIYESKSGRIEKRRFADGKIKNIPCHTGKEGIVTIVKVLTIVYEYEDSEPTEYTNGSTIWWRYHAGTENISSHGFVAKKTLNNVLGYKDGNRLRGFGDRHSGIKKIDASQSNELIRLFNNNFDNEVKKLLKSQNRIPRDGFGSTSGGEGELHKRIKESIAKNPSLILNEPGLKHIKTEFTFMTSDRVDVLLSDSFGRFVVVEVEPECTNGNEIGSAQCMKYRSLMAFQSNRRESEIRAILAAPKIDQEIRNRAKKYGIEPVIVTI